MVTDVQTIPIGYKITEAGVIPEDWEVVFIDDICTVIMGQSPPGSSYNKSGSGIALINGPTEFREKHPIKIQWTSLPTKFCKAGDILICVRGSSTGKINISNDNYCIGRGVAAIRSNGIINQSFLEYQVRNAIKIIITLTAGSTFPNIDGKTLQKISTSLPPLPEQTAIAIVLSDTDALIVSLEKLIAKKKAIKQGTMQQLLTGKKRLPGFVKKEGYKQTEIGMIPEDWEVVSYGQVFDFLSTANYSRADLSENNEVEYIHYGDIHTKWNYFLDFEKNNIPSIEREKTKNYSLIKEGDLIMADASEDYEGIGKSVEVKNIGIKEAISGLHTFLLRDKNNVFVNGFRGYISVNKLVKNSLDRLATGLKVYGISKVNLKIILIPLPSKEEQTAIAIILSDMDAEIEQLEQKRDKYKQIKQGMMQQLLTGKIRLV